MATQTTVSVGFHQGQTILRMSGHYAKIHQVLAEISQNSVDSSATRIDISIDLKGRTFTVLDNGVGCSQEKFHKSLHSLNRSIKDANQFGRYGMGLMAAVKIAELYEFTTCSDTRTEGYLTYIFQGSLIATQAVVEIPVRKEDLCFDPDGKTWWRSRTRCTKIIKDRRITAINLESFVEDLIVKFGEEIRARKIDISIKIRDADGEISEAKVVAPEFAGLKLDLYSSSNAEAGKVTIELHQALQTKSGRKGEITFGTMDNPSRISALQFVQSTGNFLDRDVAKVLLSRIFEGKILCEKVILHEDRTKFSDNDALFALCEILEGWYKKIGKALFEKANEQVADDRFRIVGESVMPYAELLLGQPDLKGVASQIVIGTVGKGHTEPDKKSIVGQDDGTSKAVFSGVTPRENGEPKDRGERKPPTKDRPQRTPGIIYSPGGRIRTEVRGHSTGLRFEYIEMQNFRIPFAFDVVSGTLSFNTNHPNWSACQVSDSILSEYQIAIITMALSLELSRHPDPAFNDAITKFSHENLNKQVFAILNGKAMIQKKEKP